jgi:hypothetical protein
MMNGRSLPFLGISSINGMHESGRFDDTEGAEYVMIFYYLRDIIMLR